MRCARIAELLEPFLSNSCHSQSGPRPSEEAVVLSPSQLAHISTYIDLLIRWNSRINLTAIRDPEEIVTRHFGESLLAARHLFPGVSSGSAVVEGLGRLADLGSGAGFPGIPIKLWAPGIALTLIESNHKKATFLREVVRSLTLTNIDVQNTRAEAITQTYEIVTLRAIEHFADALRVAARLTTPSGRMALLVGSSQLDEAHSTLPQVNWQSAVPVPQSQSRVVLIGRWGHEGKQVG
jgi:16S rRNA (guanine527-N7)-methyltransferase